MDNSVSTLALLLFFNKISLVIAGCGIAGIGLRRLISSHRTKPSDIEFGQAHGAIQKAEKQDDVLGLVITDEELRSFFDQARTNLHKNPTTSTDLLAASTVLQHIFLEDRNLDQHISEALQEAQTKVFNLIRKEVTSFTESEVRGLSRTQTLVYAFSLLQPFPIEVSIEGNEFNPAGRKQVFNHHRFEVKDDEMVFSFYDETTSHGKGMEKAIVLRVALSACLKNCGITFATSYLPRNLSGLFAHEGTPDTEDAESRFPDSMVLV